MDKPVEGLTFLDPTPSIDPVAQNKDLKAIVDDEAFMNELVVVSLQMQSDANQPPYVLVNVNGRNQVIPRGRPVAVRRMFIEVLARMKETKYTQQANPNEPDRITNVENHQLVNQFSVIRDENPRGFAWLQNILNEPA